MYKSLLIFKYLRKRRIAWVSLVAVMLCTAMVLVVISVMGGWLEMFKAKFRGMSGDIVVYRQSLTGFGGYEQMLAQIKKLPEVDEALPLIRTLGLLNVSNKKAEGVEVTGLDLNAFSHFNNFRQSLWRQYQEPVQNNKTPPTTASFDLPLPAAEYRAYRSHDKIAAKRPGMIVGGPLIYMQRDKNGKTENADFMYDLWCSLEVIPLSDDAMTLHDAAPSANVYWIVDASRTQLYQLDERSVYVPFDVLQKDLKMDAQPYQEVGDDGKPVDKIHPARCSEIQINLKPGFDRAKVIPKINDIVQSVVTSIEPFSAMSPVHVEPWEKQQETFLHAVENEKSLVTFLFALISLVAIFLIFCILYMIVVEKTRDIGIIKSVGATSQGVAAIFLGYGLAIGIVGGGLGFLIALGIVKNINAIHAAMSRFLGITIWDPQVYAFDKIPDTMDPTTAVVVVAVAILSAVIGAVLPAIRAARLNPVEALRFE